MTEFTGSERSELDTGDVRDGRSDTPMEMGMERARVVTSIAEETAGVTKFEAIERNQNIKRRMRSEAQATPVTG
jgi:hypothetical protein